VFNGAVLTQGKPSVSSMLCWISWTVFNGAVFT